MTAAFAQTAAPSSDPVYTFYSTVFGTSVVKPGLLTGWVYELEPGTQRLPRFSGRMKPVATVYTNSLNVPLQDFTAGFPGVPNRFEWFAIDYSGRFWVSKKGKYQFVLESDDGSVLSVDDRVVIDNDGIHSVLAKKGSVSLREGVHQIRISYFQGPRLHVALRLLVARPGQGIRVFNTDEFGVPASR